MLSANSFGVEKMSTSSVFLLIAAEAGEPGANLPMIYPESGHLMDKS
jgi:hypothetical protein